MTRARFNRFKVPGSTFSVLVLVLSSQFSVLGSAQGRITNARTDFWLAQRAGGQAVATINGAIDNDPDTEVKKKAVFALSQLPMDEGVSKLMDVARREALRGDSPALIRTRAAVRSWAFRRPA